MPASPVHVAIPCLGLRLVGAAPALVCLLLAILVPARPAHGQDARPAASELHDLAVVDEPLDDALRRFIRSTALNVAYEPMLVSGKRVSCVIEQAPVDRALRCLLRDAGLTFVRLDSGLIVLRQAPAEAARAGSFSGRVLDRSTGVPLPYAHVVLADTALGTTTDLEGRFAFDAVPAGRQLLVVSYLGYATRADTLAIAAGAHHHHDVYLAPRALLVAPIVVDGIQNVRPSSRLGIAEATAPAGSIPALSTSGVAPTLAALMGVHLNDATADVHVQGGKSGDHQYQLDGAPIFLPNALGSIIGPFSPFAVGRIEVHKAGYGASEGSQLSGVIGVEHALDRPEVHAVDVQADALSLNARAHLHAVRPGGREGSLMIAGRSGLWNLYASPSLRTLLEDWNTTDPLLLAAFGLPALTEAELPAIFASPLLSTGDPSLGFHDVHSAARISFAPGRTLHGSVYWGQRRLDTDRDPLRAGTLPGTPDERLFRDYFTWTTAAGQVRYGHLVGRDLLGSIQLRSSQYELRHEYGPAPGGTGLPSAPRLAAQDDQNRIHEYAAAFRLERAGPEEQYLRAGLTPTYTRSRFIIQGTQALPIDHATADWRLASFAESRLRIAASTFVELGGRLTYLPARRRVYAEPRFALRHDRPESPIGPWALRIGGGLYRQFVNQFDVSSRSPRALLSANRIWLVTDASMAPPKASHVAAEWLVQPAAGWTLRLEGYLKHLLHILSIDYAAEPTTRTASGAARSDRFPQSTFLQGGTGYAHGAAFQIERRAGSVRAETRYEYSFAERSIAGLYRSVFDPVPWNEPHQVHLALDWTPYPEVAVLARWRSVWDRTWAFRQAYYDFFGAHPDVSEQIPEVARPHVARHIEAFAMDEPRANRLPPIHQLDVSGAYTLRVGALLLQARLDLLNVLGRTNVADRRFVPNPAYADEGVLLQDERLLLPFTPALALRLTY